MLDFQAIVTLLTERTIIPNDTKLFAQADTEPAIGFYLSSDVESNKVFTLLKREGKHPRFQFLDLHIPHSEIFGLLDL